MLLFVGCVNFLPKCVHIKAHIFIVYVVTLSTISILSYVITIQLFQRNFEIQLVPQSNIYSVISI